MPQLKALLCEEDVIDGRAESKCPISRSPSKLVNSHCDPLIFSRYHASTLGYMYLTNLENGVLILFTGVSLMFYLTGRGLTSSSDTDTTRVGIADAI